MYISIRVNLIFFGGTFTPCYQSSEDCPNTKGTGTMRFFRIFNHYILQNEIKILKIERMK